MGQYYRVAINRLGDKNEVVYSDRKVRDYGMIGAKLLEHSYFGNVLMDAVANNLHNYETKLAWIGDYAEPEEVETVTKGEASYVDCYGKNDENGNTVVESKVKFVFDYVKFNYSKKFLVNLSKKEYISFDEYMAKATNKWQYNPISILTAIGNGRGGGDFYSEDEKVMEKVGSWAWDILTIDDEEPKDMTKLDINFGQENI